MQHRARSTCQDSRPSSFFPCIGPEGDPGVQQYNEQLADLDFCDFTSGLLQDGTVVGFLGATSWLGLPTMSLQYWQTLEDLHAYAR